MGWVRTNKRRGTWLALAAMALQLVLSFGHIHLGDIKGSGGNVISVAASNAPASPQDSPTHPAGDTDDYCAICAVLHLAASSFVPDAPVLPVPFAFRRTEHFTHATSVSVALQRAPFQSRAPPLA
jgi:Protein of unknown function (DUF2946)